MSEVSSIGVLTAFAAGIISFLSPCVLPLVPGYLSYVTGESIGGGQQRAKLHVLMLSGLFVLGFSAVFVALGASASALGRLLLAYRYEMNIIGGIIVIVFGLFMLGGMRTMGWLSREARFEVAMPGGRPAAAFLLGTAFGFGWTPCIGPVLGTILTVSAVSTSVAAGVILLAIYSLGLGVPFLLSAVFLRGLAQRYNSLRKLGRTAHILAGVVMIVMGIAMITGKLTAFNSWLLQTFPVLGRIG
ncbi:MAG: sulfite exporter TauE/SafE family protein [Betaproteobacteria bacterium]|nr:sulfite exporter TauE/SafE family protein [Betaproteobacteria bacterium]